MAYLPSDVLKKLREAAKNGSKNAQKVLKSTGNSNSNTPQKPVTPARTAPNSQPTSQLQKMLAQTNPSEQATVPAWVKALEDKPYKEDKEKQKRDFMKITEQANSDAEKRRKQAKEDADRRNAGSYLDVNNFYHNHGDEILDHIEKDTAKFATNAKYKVNVVDSSNSKYAMDKDVELWYISDTNGVHESKANSVVTSIGKNNLDGAQEGQNYVLYNKRTNELYQYSGDTEATDNVKKYQEAEDKYDKMYYSGQQSIAELEKKLESIDNTLQFKCEQYHIDITKPLSDYQLSIIQDYIDEYDTVEEQLRTQQYSINRSLNTQADYIANLKSKQDITKAIDLNEYLIAQSTVQKYADIQAALSGQMSRKDYLAQYKINPTVQEMNKLAQKAVDAQYILDNAGTIVDTYGRVTPELNEMANNYADLDKRYTNIVIDTAKVYNKEMTEEEFKELYGTNANTDLNMVDDKQLNSMIDVVRKFYVAERWDAKNWKDRLTAVGVALDDCKIVKDTNIDAVKNGHLVTPVLNIMRDAGNVLTGYATAAFNARGFSGKRNVNLAGNTVSVSMRDQLGDGLDQSFTFKDGALQNAEYYYNKADDRDYLTGLDRLKQNIHNWDVAMEAQLRGDLSGDLTVNNVAITNNGVEMTYLDQHPLVLGALDLAANIVFDPSTYVTAIANSTGKISETAAGKELTSKYSSMIRQALLDAGVADDMIDAEKIAKILDNTLDAQMLKRGAKQLDESGVIRAVNSVADNTDFIVKYSDEATKLNTLKRASEEATRMINDVATDSVTAKLWEDCFSSARTASNWRKLDQTINDFQMGFIPTAVRECIKPAIKDFKIVLNGGIKTMGVSDKITVTTANWFNGFLERVTKLTHGGKTLEELRTFSKLEKGMGAAAVSDIIKSADNLDDAVRGVSGLSKLSDTTRVEVIRGIVDADMQNTVKAVQGLDTVGINNLKPTANSVQDLLDFSYATDEVIDNIIATSTNGQYSSFTDYAEALRGLAKEVDSPFTRRSVSDTVEANINAMKKHIDRYNTLALRREYAVMKDAVRNYRAGGLDILKTIDVTKIAPELETPLYNIISDIERTLADEATTSAVRDLVKQLDGIVDNYGEIGTKVHSRYGRPFSSVQNQMQIEAMINAQRFEHITPTQYLEGIANHYGVQFTPEQIDTMVKQSMEKFNDVETAGKYYVFKESSEMNLNGIMNNKSLDKFFSDEEALDKVATICGYDIAGSARFNKSAVSSVQNELLFSLRECTENGNYNYHMLMDTCSGNADTINKYYSAYKQCSKLADKDMVLERMSRELAQHANTVHCAAYGTDLLPEDQIVAHLKEAFGTAFELDNNSYCTFMPTRDSVYSAIASANTALLLSDREDAMALSTQLEQILQEGAYTTTNDQLGMILSNAQLDDVLRQLTNNADVHVDQLKEVFDAMIEGDFEKSIGLRTLIDSDDASKFVTRDMVNKAAGTGTALTQELADYVHDWNMLYDNINDNLFTPEQLDQIRKTILAQANNLTSPEELRYLDYIAHADINDTGRCTAMLIDAQQRLGIDVRTTCAALKLKDVNLGELYTAAIKDKYIYKGKKLNAIVNMSTNEQFVSYMAKADYMDNLDVALRKNDNQYKTMSAMLDATTGSDEERALLAYRIGRMEETNKVYNEFNDAMSRIGTQREIDTLRKVEEGLWNENIRRVLNMSKDELDATLVRSASNGIVCDTTNPKIAQWVADREMEGYVITHTQVAGQSVSIVSLDFNALDDTRKEFLRTATFESSKVKNFNGLVNRGNYDADTLDMLQKAYNNNLKHLGDDWNRSTLGSQVSMKWHNELQAKLPIQCRLDGSFTNLHNNAYMCNMLVSPETARACGAYKGHLLGSWFYADVAGTMKSVDVDNFTNAIMSGSTKLRDIMASDKPNVTFVKLKEAGYHIIDMNDVAKLQSGEAVKTRVIDLTNLMEVRKELSGTTITHSNTLGYRTILEAHPNAIVVDDSVFRYITNETNATNRAFNYLTSSKTLQKVMDISDQMRNVYIQGQLYLANIKGTGFRNIIDSNIKALNEIGIDGMPAYTANWVKMVDIQNNYVEKMARIVEETGIQGTDGIYKYLLKHQDENAEQLLKWHTVFTLTGTADDDIAKLTRIAKNNALLDNLSVQLKPEQKKLITQAFDRARDSHVLSRKRMTDTDKFNAIFKELNKIDDEVIMQNVDEIAKLYGQWIDGKAMNWADKLFEANNLFGTALNKINKTTFDNAEVRCRNAMLLTMMDNGQDAVYANTKVIKTQFDYGTQKGLVNSWDKVMPFSKYQFCNAAYWLDNTNYSAFATRNAQRLAQATGYYVDRDPEEYFKYQAAIAYIRSHNDEPQDSTEATFLQSVNNVIENYKGVKGEYTQGGIELGDGHLLKIGNGMVDTYQWVGKILAAPVEIENGYVPTFLKDTIFSPIPTLGEAMTDLLAYVKDPYRENAFEAFDKYAGKNYYDLLAMIPIYGNLANIAISAAKNLKANQTLLGLTMCSPAISKEFLKTLAGEAEAVGMSALYSIFGIENTKGNRKVFMPYTDADGNKVTWSKLTVDEKANYLFLPGISQDKEWVTTPSALYGLYGRLAELGLNKEDIKLLTKCKYKNESLMYDSNGNLYVDTAALETTVLDMLEHGYTTYEIWKLLSYNDKWYDLNTHRIIGTPAELEREALSKAFLEGYQIIPDYIKYQPDMYKEMMERYKALGMTTAEAWRVMATNPAYIDENGYFEYLNDRQVNDYNTWVKNEYFEGQQDDGFLQWYSQLPEYIKYEKGAYSRTLAYLKQMFTTDEAKQMIANGAYYTVDGRLIDCKGLSRTRTKASGAFQDEAGYWHKAGDFQYDGYWYHKGDNPYLGLGSFQNYWNTLPDYLRYTKGAWSRTNSVFKEAGIDYNTRMKAMQDGAYAVQVDPNSDYFKELLAKQNLVSITKTVYVTKEVPLRECSQVNGEWVWNGAQSIKCDDNGNGYSVELIQKNLEFNAAGLGVAAAAKWKSYDAAMVTVKVPQTITEVGQDPNQIMYRIVTDKDGRTWVIVPCPPYNKPPRGGYYKKGYPQKYWNKYHKDKFKKNKRYYTTRGYVNTNQKPMKIDYSNVRTYSKQHFLQQQGLGYKYWTQWGDGRIENHRNRYGRKVAPSTYRNPRAKQRSLYKDLYAKHGASRMNMRQNIAGYSNASVTRLRRNEIANRTYNLLLRNKI